MHAHTLEPLKLTLCRQRTELIGIQDLLPHSISLLVDKSHRYGDTLRNIRQFLFKILSVHDSLELQDLAGAICRALGQHHRKKRIRGRGNISV